MPARNDDPKSKGLQYPYYPISSAIKMAEAVRDLGGARAPVKKNLLAKHLGEEETSSAFSQQITSAKIFGVVDGFGEYLLTEIAKRYFFPTAESEKSHAMLDVFVSPSAYKKLVERFDGQAIPTKEILANIMHRELNVPTSWKERSAALFLNSAQYVGATDERGILRVGATREQTHRVANDRPLATALEPPSSTPRPVAAPRPGVVNWNYKDILVQTPEELDIALWQKLNGYVQLLKPSE